MGEWLKTTCALCANTCGLEVQVENNRIVRVRGDKSNPKTQGYCCRKGRSIKYFQHAKDRTRYPLKRVGEDQFIQISWDQAITEICDRLKKIVDEYGPRSFAGQGLGGFMGSAHTVLAKNFMGCVGSQLHYRALAAELTGKWWATGKMLGNQDYSPSLNEKEGEVLICCGTNTYVTHNMTRAKRVIPEIATNPNKYLIVIDPRRTETARMADIHLAIRHGTDALFWKAMLKVVIDEDWVDHSFIETYTTGYEGIVNWLKDVNPKEYFDTCCIDYEDARKLAYLCYTKKAGTHTDLGVICGRHSTLVTYFQYVFFTLTGNMLTRGGMTICHSVFSKANTPPEDPKYWKNHSGYSQVCGLMPTATLAADIDNEDPDRIRALFCVNSNPVHSIVNTPSVIKALKKLDLLVTVDCAMTETARLSDYVLPNTTAYECNEVLPFGLTYPGIFTQIRHPVLKPEYEVLNTCEIWLRLEEKMGYLPKLPESLYEAAKGPRSEYRKALAEYLQENPEYTRVKVAIIARTLGAALGDPALGVIWAVLQTKDAQFRKECAAAGFEEGPDQLDQVFQALLDHPEGLNVGYMDSDHLLELLQTDDHKIHMYLSELDDWVAEITPEQENKLLNRPEFPLALIAGRHFEGNINHTMRGPEWVAAKGNQFGVLIHPSDAEALGIQEGQIVKITTEVGTIEAPAQITRDTCKGSVVIPHGFGINYAGSVQGVNINLLTPSTGLDRIAGTPCHRYVHCRVEVAE